MPGSSVASETDKIPKSTFEIYRTEGDSLFRSGEYKKAISCYTQALELRPGDRHCLVTRSKCHLYKGEIIKALEDAEESLQEDKNFHKGIYQKAEVLYFRGDFENALIYFHRGYRQRPEMEDFRRGIQKCEEAINNAVGDPTVVKLRSDGDLSYFYKGDEEEKSKKKQGRGGYQKPKQVAGLSRRAERKRAEADDRTVRTLLGELYNDREYLEKILKDEDSRGGKRNESSEKIRELAINGLNYLDARSEFWQEQQPMYSRKRDRRIRSAMSTASSGAGGPSGAVKYVIVNLDAIDDKQTRGDHDGVLKHASRVLKQVNSWSQSELPNKMEVITNLYSVIGNSHLEMGKYARALEFHEKDLALGKTNNIPEAISRSLDNIGRVHAKKGEYRKAIEIWEEKLPLSKSALESTWLHHEIGRCYLQLGDHIHAKEYGKMSLSSAKEASDDSWELNACVLIAEAETSLEEYQAASDSFERALDFAKILGNKHAEEAIAKAIQSVNTKIIEKSKAEEKAFLKEEENDRQKQNEVKEKEKEHEGKEPQHVQETEQESVKRAKSPEEKPSPVVSKSPKESKPEPTPKEPVKQEESKPEPTAKEPVKQEENKPEPTVASQPVKPKPEEIKDEEPPKKEEPEKEEPDTKLIVEEQQEEESTTT